MTFLDKLKALDAKATPGPWEWSSNEDGYPTELVALGVGVLRPALAVSPRDGALSAYITNDAGTAEPEHPDFELIVAFRNSTARLIALVAACHALLDGASGPMALNKAVALVRTEHLDAINAALTALSSDGGA